MVLWLVSYRPQVTTCIFYLQILCSFHVTMSEILVTIMDAVFNGTLTEDAGMETAYDRFLY